MKSSLSDSDDDEDCRTGEGIERGGADACVEAEGGLHFFDEIFKMFV